MTSIGDYDQAMVLTQYLINNGIDNLWIQDGNSDTPTTSTFNLSQDGVGSLENASLSSPRVIFQPESDAMGINDAEIIILQLRFKSGLFKANRGSNSVATFNLSGWKIGYRARIQAASVDATRAQALSSKLPSLPNGASYSITKMKLSIIPSSSNPVTVNQINAYTDWASSTDSLTALDVIKFHQLFVQKLIELDKSDLLISGYNARAPSDQATSSAMPTFVPTGRRLQMYPWIGADPLAQPSYGLQGNARMNYLCFLEMTSGNTMPILDKSAIPVTGNWSSVVPPTLATAKPLPKSGWTVTGDSEESGFGAALVLDGNTNNFWHTRYTPTTTALPHNLVIDMKIATLVNGLTYLPRQDGTANGRVGKYTIELSTDGISFTWAAGGFFYNDSTLKQVFFTPTPARYLRFTALSEAQDSGNQWTSAAEINILSNALTLTPDVQYSAADNAEPGNEATKAMDSNLTTIWHTAYTNSLPSYPHYFTISRQTPTPVSGLSYIPRQGGGNGTIGAYRVEQGNPVVKKTPFGIPTVVTEWTTVASGSWPDDASPKTAQFSPTTAPAIRLVALSEAGGRGPWASASEIKLLDGTAVAADVSSTDFGRFVVSRRNFFERYLYPKLRILNAALEAKCDSPQVTIGKAGAITSQMTWAVPNLRVGDPNTDFSSAYDFRNLSVLGQSITLYSSTYPSGDKSQTKDYFGDYFTGEASCSTANRLTYSGNTITINGSSTVSLRWLLESGVEIFGKSVKATRQDEKINITCTWTITLTLTAVSDGGLAINMVTNGPNLSDTSSGIKYLSDRRDYVQACFRVAMTRFSSLEQDLQRFLQGQQRFTLPAAGNYFYKNPRFNVGGDLSCDIAFNGNAGEDGNNSGVPDRRNIPFVQPDQAPGQPPTIVASP